MNKILKSILIIIMIVSLIGNAWLILTVAYVDSDWQSQYMQKDIQWCENTNSWIDVTNDLVYELQYYDDIYYELNMTEKVDCWGYYED